MLDQRSLAEKSADLELQIVHEGLMDRCVKLHAEGLDEPEILGACCEELEERLAHLYRELYEIGEG